MENSGKITQKLLNTHYEVFFSYDETLNYYKKKNILSDIENKRKKKSQS